METRNILNYQGQVIGEMQKANGTSEEAWAAALAPYAAAPLSQQQLLSAVLDRTVSQGRAAAEKIIETIKKDNLASFIEQGKSNTEMLDISLWINHRLRALPCQVSNGDAIICDLINFCFSGDLESAYMSVAQMVPDDMSKSYHYFTQAKIDQIKALLAQYIG
jgi:hypothetical protein